MASRNEHARGSDRGAAAVETAAVVSALLVPLLLGVLSYGMYFWKAQQVDPYAARIPNGALVGRYADCGELVAAVKTTVQGILGNADGALGSVVPLEDIGVRVVELLPTVGAVVEVSVKLPVVDELLIPLPDDGNVVSEVTMRLEDVAVTTNTCP